MNQNKNDTEQLRQQFEQVAEHLVGRKVLLRFKYPPVSGMMGEAYRPEDAPSLMMIDIRPDISIDAAYRTLLHEAAHINLGHVDQVDVTPIEKEKGGTFVKTVDYSEYSADPRESAAKVLSDKWQDWANVKVAPYIEPNYPEDLKVHLKLTALQFYKN